MPRSGDTGSSLLPRSGEDVRLTSPDELKREIEKLRTRISGLNSAILRISASLDVSTVLQEIVESARALTQARRGLIVTIDDSGQVQDYVLSGFTPDEQERLTDWADVPRIFELFWNFPETLRLRDLPGYVRSLGFPPDPLLPKTSQWTPMRHRDVHVGTFFLGGKKGGREFTIEDEEMLVMFGSQAAMAIANARTHRAEKQARADLEALVDTSPLGVVVFDAKSGRPVLFNREMKRIAQVLVTPGHPVEEVLEVVTLRRPDGWEISLEELSAAQVLSNASKIRAKETVLQMPDGRSITTLMNATPIRSKDGTNESVVITVQDLAPLEELERLRSEFLGMVSHELRAPLTSIKGSAATALNTSPTPDPAVVQQFLRIIEEQADHMNILLNDLLDAGRIETGTLSVNPVPTEVATLVDQARNTFFSGGGKHTIQIDLPPGLPWVMADRHRIVQVLQNLLSNAAKHSPQSLPVRIAAERENLHVAISVVDEGKGVPPELMPHLFRKYTRAGGSARGIEGSGLGLAICKGLVEAHGGRIRAESAGEGLGACFTFTIPVAVETRNSAATGFGLKSRRSVRADFGQTKILVVDDDPHTLKALRDALMAEGYSPLMTGDPDEVPHLVTTEQPRLVLMDLMLPGTDGIELMERIPELATLPVIFISGYDKDEMIARALEMGASDYIVKPFSPTELAARVRAALRRRDDAPRSFQSGELIIQYEDRRVTLAGVPVRLTAIEYKLLRALSVNAGRTVTYKSLLRQVWGRRDTSDPRPVRAFVRKLRRKLKDDAISPTYIFNERQVGYRMARQSDQ